MYCIVLDNKKHSCHILSDYSSKACTVDTHKWNQLCKMKHMERPNLRRQILEDVLGDR